MTTITNVLGHMATPSPADDQVGLEECKTCQERNQDQPPYHKELSPEETRQYRKTALWLLTTCESLDLPSDVLCLSIAIARRYLYRSQPQAESLQFLASVCLLVSYKYRTSKLGLSVRWVCDVHRYQYSVDEVLELQAEVLESIDFDLELPTILQCLETNSAMVDNSLSHAQRSHLLFWIEAYMVFNVEADQRLMCAAFEEILQFVRCDARTKSQCQPALINTLLERVSKCSNLALKNKHSPHFEVEEYLDWCSLYLER